MRAYRKKHPSYTAKKKDTQLRRRYGISLEERDRMAAEQGGVCAICREAKTLVVDHCHTSGEVRGLLCNDCNWMLGLAKDNPANLAAAIGYLGNG